MKISHLVWIIYLGLPLAIAWYMGSIAAASTSTGTASWYGGKFHGRTTASGERYNMMAFTAAHRTLPFGTIVTVTRVGTNQKVKVRINDRGPYTNGRIIDLSKAAAMRLNINGTARVRLTWSRK